MSPASSPNRRSLFQAAFLTAADRVVPFVAEVEKKPAAVHSCGGQ
jgi:hypothetical protein